MTMQTQTRVHSPTCALLKPPVPELDYVKAALSDYSIPTLELSRVGNTIIVQTLLTKITLVDVAALTERIRAFDVDVSFADTIVLKFYY
jgi:hypothetical protein